MNETNIILADMICVNTCVISSVVHVFLSISALTMFDLHYELLESTIYEP